MTISFFVENNTNNINNSSLIFNDSIIGFNKTLSTKVFFPTLYRKINNWGVAFNNQDNDPYETL